MSRTSDASVTHRLPERAAEARAFHGRADDVRPFLDVHDVSSHGERYLGTFLTFKHYVAHYDCGPIRQIGQLLGHVPSAGAVVRSKHRRYFTIVDEQTLQDDFAVARVQELERELALERQQRLRDVNRFTIELGRIYKLIERHSAAPAGSDVLAPATSKADLDQVVAIATDAAQTVFGQEALRAIDVQGADRTDEPYVTHFVCVRVETSETNPEVLVDQDAAFYGRVASTLPADLSSRIQVVLDLCLPADAI
jgi:hypothetical protein